MPMENALQMGWNPKNPYKSNKIHCNNWTKSCQVPRFSQTSIESDVGVILPMLHSHVVLVCFDIPNSTNG